MAIFFRVVFFIPLFLFGALSEEQYTRRIYDYLILQDNLSAVTESKQGIDLYPDSISLLKATFRALCQQGDELGAMKIFEKFSKSEKEERSILEALAWGVLNKAKESPQLEIRLNVLKAASFTKDVKALPIILKEMRSSSAILRSLAIQMASHFGDEPLRKELEHLLKEEKVWFVRLQVIQAIGKLRMSSMQENLKKILIHPKISLEERGSVQIALVNLYDDISHEELLSLIRSDRAALRHLACDLVAYLELVDLAVEIYPLVNDTVAEVRIAAINALTLLKKEESFPLIQYHLEDPSVDVAISSAWAAMVFEPKLGEKWLQFWLKAADVEHGRMAAAALSISGVRGIPLAFKMMKESTDLYMKATLAIGLIHQREHLFEAQALLYKLLLHPHTKEWMWEGYLNPLFSSLAPSRMKHREGIPQFPKVVDQKVRLELLSLLCITHYPKAEEAIRAFLKSDNWGITTLAAAVLLEEGNATSIEISQKLLKDADEKVRLQAAFLLALMGDSEEALPILKEAYPRLDREMKLHVIGAIAQVGDLDSIPFLIEQLKEPFQLLRVAAASALIQCLYH